jgi:hypothetical protein
MILGVDKRSVLCYNDYTEEMMKKERNLNVLPEQQINVNLYHRRRC